jgi:hypothetical protein
MPKRARQRRGVRRVARPDEGRAAPGEVGGHHYGGLTSGPSGPSQPTDRSIQRPS